MKQKSKKLGIKVKNIGRQMNPNFNHMYKNSVAGFKKIIENEEK